MFNVDIVERSQFVRDMQKGAGGGFGHSIFSKAEMVYTSDESLRQTLNEIRDIGERDMELSAMLLACDLIGVMEKCQKWLYVKRDNAYCQYYILKAADAMARLEVCLAYGVLSREAILKAEPLNPAMIERYYREPMRRELDRDELEQLISGIDEYIMGHIDVIAAPALRYLADGEVKSAGMLAKQFRTSSHGIVHLMEYLAEKGVVEKAGQPIRLTPKSRPTFDEAAYVVVKE